MRTSKRSPYLKSNDEKKHNHISNAASQNSVLTLTTIDFDWKTGRPHITVCISERNRTSMQFKFHGSLTTLTRTAFLPN